MKISVYIFLVLAGLLLPATEEVRSSVVRLVKDAVSAATSMVIRGNHAEVRFVDGKDYEDLVLNEKERLVVVVFGNKIRSTSRSEERDFDMALRKLPSSVLVAKVNAEGNGDLLRKHNVYKLPNIRIYKAGSLVRNFGSEVDVEELCSVVENYLNYTSGRMAAGYIGPMEKDWLPQGVLRTSPGNTVPEGRLESK